MTLSCSNIVHLADAHVQKPFAVYGVFTMSCNSVRHWVTHTNITAKAHKIETEKRHFVCKQIGSSKAPLYDFRCLFRSSTCTDASISESDHQTCPKHTCSQTASKSNTMYTKRNTSRTATANLRLIWQR